MARTQQRKTKSNRSDRSDRSKKSCNTNDKGKIVAQEMNEEQEDRYTFKDTKELICLHWNPIIKNICPDTFQTIRPKESKYRPKKKYDIRVRRDSRSDSDSSLDYEYDYAYASEESNESDMENNLEELDLNPGLKLPEIESEESCDEEITSEW